MFFFQAAAGELTNQQDHVKSFFTDATRFGFEKPVGNGGFGFGLLFHERLPDGTQQRFVVKRAMAIQSQVENEIVWLKLLQHAKHVVNLVHIERNPLEPNAQGQGGIMGPFIVMEYLENGTLDTLASRTEGVDLPNRVVTFILLCLTRACIGMAYPPPGPNPDGSQPEETTDPSKAPGLLAHFDINNGNVMFGRLDRTRREHALLPILKLIDFGLASNKDYPSTAAPQQVAGFDAVLQLEKHRTNGATSHGVEANICDIANVLVLTLARIGMGTDEKCRREMMNPNNFAHLDNDLRLLIARCLAADPSNRPKLDDLLARLQQLVRDQADIAYAQQPGKSRESDAEIEAFVQRYILDAPI
ncbi:kinase-like domain-containing protein [Biscogniauxia marginata]|nr:kinase-like domain-containing protein [Biscogniauxia marginata]